MRKRTRLIFIGWGAINARAGALLRQRNAPVEIVAIAKYNAAGARNKLPSGVPFLGSADELAALKPDIVIEAAGRAAVAQWAPAALAAAPVLIIASTSAFCEQELLVRLLELAGRHGSQIQVPSGAIGGIDALASAAILGLDEVVHQIIKPPQAWKNTPAEKLANLDSLTGRTILFSGTARQAASEYPQNANATVVTALAGIGLDRTRVEIVADPESTKNGHRIVANGKFGHMEITLENNPLAANPKSSELTVLSLVRLIEHRINSLVV
jgi:aspartate dehydrogenase